MGLEKETGPAHLVLDLSCRRKDGAYYIMTDRWQTWTDLAVTPALLEELAGHCDEFLVHAVDAEGKAAGVEEELIRLLSLYAGKPVTYAGGIGSTEDLEKIRRLGGGRMDFTIGSALDLFGGSIPFEEAAAFSASAGRPCGTAAGPGKPCCASSSPAGPFMPPPSDTSWPSSSGKS